MALGQRRNHHVNPNVHVTSSLSAEEYADLAASISYLTNPIRIVSNPPEKMMSPLSEQILQSITLLPEEDQRQILDFVEFIKAKRQRTAQTQSEDTPRSFLETAQAIIGMGEGPGDLSTNPAYMEGYGE